MIIKGGARAGGRELAIHLERRDTNEKVRLFGTDQVAAKSVRGALAEMEAIASASRSTKPLYHVSISPDEDERLTDEQWGLAADTLGDALGLTGHQRVMVLHTKVGKTGVVRQHAHLVWNRVDADTLKVAHHSHNFRTHEEVARALEREFGLKRVQGVHAEREGEREPRKRAKNKESQQGARTGWPAEQAQADILAAWQRSDNGAAFRAHLLGGGYELAKGDRRDFVILDPHGGTHSIRSGVKGLRVADVRAKLSDLDRDALPTVTEAKAALALLAAEDERGKSKTKEKAKEKQQAQGQAPLTRLRRPEPGRYTPLVAEMVALKAAAKTPEQTPNPSPTPPARKLDAPQCELKPPMWTTGPLFINPSPVKQPPVQRPPVMPAAELRRPPAPVVRPPAELPKEVTALIERQRRVAAGEMATMTARHRQEDAALSRHFQVRLAEVVAGPDKRIQELNGFLSRVASLANVGEWKRELAYQVAIRQRGQEKELVRQAAERAEVAAAQAQERLAAERRRLEREALQRAALNKTLAKSIAPMQRQRPPRGYER